MLTFCLAFSLLPTAALADEAGGGSAAEGEQTNYVAQIGSTGYASLADAIAAAKDGNTVKLLDNVDLTETLIIKDKTITLDLNGKTISNSTDIWNENTYSWSLISVRDNGNLTIDDTAGGGTLKAKENDCYALDVYVYDTKNVENTKLTINAGNYVGNVSAVYAFTGKVTINGGHFSIQQLSSSNDYRFMLNCYDASYTAGTAGFTVNGGTFVKFDPSDSASENPHANFLAEGYGVKQDDDNYIVTEPVAAIGDTKYPTLAAAVAAVHEKTGNERNQTYTIELLRDATGGGFGVGYNKIENGTTEGNNPVHINIEMNGHTYTVDKPTVGSSETETNGFQLLKGSTVTFKNGTLNSVTGKGNLPNGGILIQNYCDLTLENVTLDTSANSNIRYVISNNFGSLTAKGDTVIKAADGKVAFDLWYGMNNDGLYDEGVSVTFGTDFTGSVTGKIEYGAANRASAMQWPGKTKLTIENGSFDVTFKDSNTDDGVSLADANITITGGTFSSDVSAYVPNGYIQNENGAVETLGETNAVAKIGNTYYKSLVDAYADMVKMCSSTSEPIVITLLKDSEGGGMGSDKDPALNYVIDFNGHTYTVGAPAVGSTGTVSQGLRVLKGSTAKFMNGTLKAANYNRLVQVVHTYGDVTFQDFTVDATEDAYAWAAVEPDAGTLKVLGNSSILAREGQYGLYAAFWHIDSYNGTTVDVDTTGKITGKLAYEFDEDYTDPNKATVNEGFVNIKNGNFDILSIQEIWSDVSNEVDKNVGGIIISGGYFTSDPTAYLAAGKYVIKSDKAGYTYAVTGTKPEKTPIFVDENTTHDTSAITDGTTRSAIDAVINKAKVEGVAAAVDESALVASKVDASEVDAAKKVEVEVSVKVEVKSADLSGENAAKTLTFEAKPVATITVTKSDNTTVTKNNVPVPNSLLSGEITVKLPLPAGFTPEQIKHISSDRSVEYFLRTAKRGAKPFEIKDGCAVFTITKFSTFELSGTVTYVEPSYSSGSSYDPTYSVTVDKTKNGSVTVSPKSASKGDTVTVTVKPDSGYVLETLTVTDKNGNELTLKDKGNGKYTFTMPAGKVEVKATFMEDNSMLNFFYDVPNNAYFYEAVKWAVENGITTGVGNDLFAPEQPCTRAQIVTFLWRAAGSPEPKGAASGMTDVVSGSYYEKAVAWAIENGITTGTTTSTFSPDVTCTRAQAVTFLARALKAKAASAAEFSDVPTGNYFADAVAWAAANGVTEGIGGGLFGSDNDCTRGQIVTFLYRAYNK